MYKSNNVAERIKLVAKAKGIPVNKMLEDIDLGRNTMSNFKTSMPKADNLAKIADYLGCSVDYLLGRTEKIPADQTVNELTKNAPVALEYDESTKKLITAYEALNAAGKEKAIERVLELSEIPKYQVRELTPPSYHPHSTQAILQKYRDQGINLPKVYHETKSQLKVAETVILPDITNPTDK